MLCGACVQTCPANLQAGADAEAKEQSGQRAIDVAAGARQREVVELLLPRTAPEEGQEWSADGLMERAASAAHLDHQHSDCCGCAHDHPHVDEQVLARLGSNKAACCHLAIKEAKAHSFGIIPQDLNACRWTFLRQRTQMTQKQST